MVRRTNSLYLIRVEPQVVAVIPAKNPPAAISRYIETTGFDSSRTYFCNYLKTTTVHIGARNPESQHYFVLIGNNTNNENKFVRLSALRVVRCDNVFSLADPKDIINNPLFIRPTIEEVRNCIGFSKEPMYQLRKFCI